ncbi:UNVERIFIED_ORG: hypothetical protein LHK14_17890 [Roseateles sp. XES5]|nr:hypothetical protein [Roseateles sp. XES5]
MLNRNRADGVAELVRQFASQPGAAYKTPEAIAADLIGGILHWVMRAGEMAGDDGRKPALAAARLGLGSFISDVHASPAGPKPACYTLITVRTDDGLWVSETGYEEVIQ